jgi:hypothetical protein
MSRMRAGEWIAGLGAAGLLVLLFFDWFAIDWDGVRARGLHGMRFEHGLPNITISLGSGWSTLGWFMDVLLCVAIFGGFALSYMTIKRTSPAWPVGAAVLTWLLGSLIFLVLLVRVTIAQPTSADELVAVRAPAYLGLLFALLIPVGGFVSIRDERTDTAEARAYTPPPPRPAPGT